MTVVSAVAQVALAASNAQALPKAILQRALPDRSEVSLAERRRRVGVLVHDGAIPQPDFQAVGVEAAAIAQVLNEEREGEGVVGVDE